MMLLQDPCVRGGFSILSQSGGLCPRKIFKEVRVEHSIVSIAVSTVTWIYDNSRMNYLRLCTVYVL